VERCFLDFVVELVVVVVVVLDIVVVVGIEVVVDIVVVVPYPMSFQRIVHYPMLTLGRIRMVRRLIQL
jgi:hypothetical protein